MYNHIYVFNFISLNIFIVIKVHLNCELNELN